MPDTEISRLTQQVDQQFKSIDSLVKETDHVISDTISRRDGILGRGIAAMAILFLGFSFVGSCIYTISNTKSRPDYNTCTDNQCRLPVANAQQYSDDSHKESYNARENFE